MGKSNMILRDIDRGILRVKNQMKNDDEESEKYQFHKKQFDALKQVKEYVDSYAWLKHKEVIEKLKFIREVDYDYKLIQEEYHISYDAAKSFVYRCSKKLGEKIGFDTVSLILSSDDKVAMGLTNFRICSGVYDLQNILLKECFADLPESKFDIFKIEDCRDEILYLYTYSRVGREFALDDLDKNKLAFIRFIMTRETKRYRKEQKDLIQVLQGINIGIDEYLERLDDLKAETEEE